MFTSSVSAQSIQALPPRSTYAPDIQVLVVSGSPQTDFINFTYPGVADPAQLEKDVNNLAAALNTDASLAQVSNKALPMNGVSTPTMTSVTIPAAGAAPTNTGFLPVDKVILGLKNYHRLAITYIMPSSFRYTGFRHYVDNNVDVSLNESGSTYSFLANIRNPDFMTLKLPAADESASQSSPLQQHRSVGQVYLLRVGGFALVLLFAVLIGWGAYTALAKLQ